MIVLVLWDEPHSLEGVARKRKGGGVSTVGSLIWGSEMWGSLQGITADFLFGTILPDSQGHVYVSESSATSWIAVFPYTRSRRNGDPLGINTTNARYSISTILILMHTYYVSDSHRGGGGFFSKKIGQYQCKNCLCKAFFQFIISRSRWRKAGWKEHYFQAI